MASATDIVKNRFLGFLIWQAIHSTLIFILFRTAFSQNGVFSLPSLLTCFSFLTFHLSLLLFSASLYLISSPHFDRPSSPYDIVLALLRCLFTGAYPPQAVLRRARAFLGLFGFLLGAALAGTTAMVSLCKSESCGGGLAVVGLRGFGFGFVYGVYYVFKRRWVLEFPIIQRPLFFRLKMGLPSAVGQAIRLSTAAYIFSGVLILFLQDQFGSHIRMGNLIFEQIIFFVGSFSLCLCWELSHHLHQVIHTKRYIFAPPKGSAAAETNPSEPLLAALEESTPKSLPQYLSYLDLCMVCDSNVDTWRRAAFFEETGETYKKVIAVCLRPLEHFASNLVEGLESSVDKTHQQSSQFQFPTVMERDSRFSELFNDSQLCTWCSWAVASLTVCSHKEDRFGVAQLSGSNAAVISTLLSCLLAVETFLGKKTNLQSPNALMGPAGIKWATVTTARRDSATSVVGKKRGAPLHSQAYAIADVLRTSIYCIVSTFHGEMLSGAKAGVLEKDWVINGKPLYGTRELLMQKLHLFLDFRAC